MAESPGYSQPYSNNTRPGPEQFIYQSTITQSGL